MIEVEWNFDAVQKKLNSLNDEVYETAIMTATQEIARVLHEALLNNTPVITGNLRKMWSAGDNLLFTVTRIDNSFEVTLINEARANSANGYQYAYAVNYGHKGKNGGWIAGRFFLEASEAQTEPQCRSIIEKNLRKYFGKWLNGR